MYSDLIDSPDIKVKNQNFIARFLQDIFMALFFHDFIIKTVLRLS